MRPILHTYLIAGLTLLGANSAASQSVTHVNLTEDQHREAFIFAGNEQKIDVCGLQPGRSYQVWINEPGSQPTIKLSGSNQAFSASFSFTASQICQEFHAKKSNLAHKKSGSNAWFSIGCLDCEKKIQGQAISKIATQGAITPQVLLNDIFLGGDCYEVSNLNAIGVNVGRGSFSDGNSTIGIPEGIILCTGDIVDAAGPNNDDQAGLNIGGPVIDPDLELFATANIQDVQGLEFDFVPTGNTVSFDYVFASEEYCEFVNTGMNDLFGFFISGPGINGSFTFNGENLAIVPTTNLYVTIDNVNQFDNSAFFVPNRANCGATTNMTDIQYDGWTTVLTATANVIPCEQYHIRLVIADVGDGIFDSAVFLGAGTFNAGGDPETGNILPSAGVQNFLEGCEPAYFTFYRDADSDINLDVPIELTLLPSSTATPGIDFGVLPNSIFIPAGQDSIVLPITVISDNISEGLESIQISVANGCECSELEYSLTISDLPSFIASLPNIEVCEGTTFNISATISNGIAGGSYSYQWSNGQITPSTNITPMDDEVISVTITDQCGTQVIANTTANVIEIPTASLSAGGGDICLDNANDEHVFTLNISGEPNWILNYTIDGLAQVPLDITSSPFQFNTNTPGSYSFTTVSTTTANCQGPAMGTADVFLGDIQNTVVTEPVGCTANGAISVTTSGGATPYIYNWGNGLPNSPNLTGLAAGNYQVTVTDDNGCTALASGMVEAVPPISVVATATQVNCNAPNIGTIDLTVNGGIAPYNFNWSNGLPSTQNQTGLGVGTYLVTITDSGDCSEIVTASVTATSVPPMAAAQATDSLDCEATQITLSGQGSQTGNEINYLWSGPGIVGADDGIEITVEEGGSYTLLVTNTSNGCTNTAIVEVEADQTVPIAEGLGGTITCVDTLVVLNGNGSSLGANFSYEWTGVGIQSGGSSLTPTVNAQGDYTLTVTNETNHCIATTTVSVGLDANLPIVEIQAPPLLDCNTAVLQLDGSNSSEGPAYTYQWYFEGNLIPAATANNLQVSAAGEYLLEVINQQNGCSEAVSVIVQQDSLSPQATASVNGQLDCLNDSVGLIGMVLGNSSNINFEWSTPNGVLTGGQTSPNATASAPGQYQLIVTNQGNGCADTVNVTVLQSNDQPDVSIATTGTLDCNTENLVLDATASSQGAEFSFFWSTTDGSFVAGENSLTPTVGAAGTYILTMVNETNNCQSQGSITIMAEENAPTIALPAQPMIDCGTNQVDIMATIGNVHPNADLSFSWSTLDGEIIGSNNSATIIAGEAGTYVLTVTNEANGCTSSSAVDVGEDLEFPMAIIQPADTINCHISSIVLNANASSQGPDYSYEWATINGSIIGSDTVLNITVNAEGTYNLLITNNLNHCSTIGQIEVYQDLVAPMAVASAIGTLNCLEEELYLNGNGSSTGPGIDYLWSGMGIVAGENTLNPLVNAPGSYQLTVTNNQNGCSATAVAILSENIEPPTAEAGTSSELSCQTNTAQLDGTGSSIGPNFIYVWQSPTNGNILSGASTLQPVVDAVGTYELLVTDTTNGCTATDLVDVVPDVEMPVAVIAAAPSLTCTVDEVVLDGTGSDVGSNLIYQWTTQDGFIVSGANGLQPAINEPGSYLLTITNTLNNCSGAASVLVDLNNTPPAASAGQDDMLDCLTTALQLNGIGSSTGAGITYNWSTINGNISADTNTLHPTIDEPGTYQLLVTNTANGCSSIDEVVVGVDTVPPIAIAASPDSLDCTTSQVALSGTGTSTGPQFNYAWSTVDGNIVSGGNSLAPMVNEPGTYSLTVTNSSNSCTQTTAIEVVQNIDYPLAFANSIDEINCLTNAVELNSTGSSIGSIYSYQWETSNGHIVSGANSTNPLVDEPGIYELTITNLQNGCATSADVTVAANLVEPQAVIAPPGQLNCLTNQVNLQATVLQGSNLDVQWSTVTGQILNGANSLLATVDQAGTYQLLLIDNTNGCSSEFQVEVSIDTVSPIADAGAPFLLGCNGHNDNLNGSGSSGVGGLSFSWSTLDGTITAGATTPTPVIGNPGTYQLTITQLSNGCTATDEVVVTTGFPSAIPLVNQPLCTGELGHIEFINLDGGLPPYSFSIDGGNNFSSQPIFSNLVPGDYEVVVSDANGCLQAAQVTISPAVQLELDLETITLIELGDSLELNVGINIPYDSIASIEWTPDEYLSCSDCLNPMTMPIQTMSFTVTVIDKNGCEDSAPITVLVKKSNDVYVPNAFSPNDDGINDKFTIFSNLDLPVKVNKFMVFSRWGESVFEAFDFMANDLNYGWDGYFKGEPMDPAVFVWYAEVEFIDGSTELLKGGVTLVK